MHPPCQKRPNPFLKALHDIQTKSRETFSGSTWRTIWRLVGSLVLVLLAITLLFLAVRVVAIGVYWPAIVAVVLALIFGFTASSIVQSLDQLLEGHYLFRAAIQVAKLLNGRTFSGYSSVRYFVFGHDHAATFRALPGKEKNRSSYRQWYVNTGAWVPVFSESERLLRRE